MYEELFLEKGLSLERLKSFVDIVEAGSISKASRGNPVLQSQLSHQIGYLEKFFKVELLDRREKIATITPEGKRLARHIKVFFQSLSDVKNQSKSKGLSLRVGAGDSLLQWLWIPRIKKIEKIFPRSEWLLDSDKPQEIVKKIQDQKLDFGILSLGIDPANIQKRLLGKIEYDVIIPKKLLPKNSLYKDWRILDGIPLAVFTSGHLRDNLPEVFLEKRIELNIAIQCTTIANLIAVIESGSFAAILSRPLINQLFNRQDYFSYPFPGFDTNLYLAYHKRLQDLRPISQIQIHHLVDALKIT